MSPTIRAYLAEFLGTFMLVFIGTAVATLQGGPLGDYGSGGLLMISFAFGGTLMVLVYVIGPVSGCHLNPAVTIPMVISGRLPGSQAAGYILSQFGGGLAASLVLRLLLSGLPAFHAGQPIGANGNPHNMEKWALLGWELILTALFLFTIFSATRKDFTPGFTALAIGGFLFIAHLVGAQLGDSSLNPARSLGPALVQGGAAVTDVWIFCVGPVIGGIVGWFLYKVVYGD